MKKFLNKIKQNDYLIYTFLTSILIIGIIYKLQEVAPFGENSLLKIDFFHQYGPMLAELYDRIHSGESLLYTFNTGLGLPFFRNFFNYLASPFNIIIFLFKRENLLLSYSILIGIKAALAATTMTYYLKKKINANKYLLIGLGLLYAFSAYFCAFYWNIMWTDGMIFLPLITLGIENIIDKQNGLLYYIKRDLDQLISDDSRPLSSSKEAIIKLYNERYALYERFCDCIVDNNGTIEETVRGICL